MVAVRNGAPYCCLGWCAATFASDSWWMTTKPNRPVDRENSRCTWCSVAVCGVDSRFCPFGHGARKWRHLYGSMNKHKKKRYVTITMTLSSTITSQWCHTLLCVQKPLNKRTNEKNTMYVIPSWHTNLDWMHWCGIHIYFCWFLVHNRTNQNRYKVCQRLIRSHDSVRSFAAALKMDSSGMPPTFPMT